MEKVKILAICFIVSIVELVANREKEARRLEKERRELQRMERMRERERRAASTRHVVMFDNAEEIPPPIPLVS